MEPFKNILVGLDTSALDKNLLTYASFIADYSSAEEVRFVNIVKNLSVPSEVKKEFPQLVENAIKERHDQIKDSVEKHFTPQKNVKTSIIVEKGQPPMLLDTANKFDADLIIIGQKKRLPGTAVTTMRLARRASCNLLIVPETIEEVTPKCEKILVPVDFSPYCKLALEQSIDFAVKTPGTTKMVCQNVYSVPVGYHYTGKSFEEFGQVMEKNARKNFKSFIEKIDTKGFGIKEVYSLDRNDNLASDIYDMANEINPDVIVIGAKGRTAAAALFLGSLAEKMVNDKMNHPLLITRYKGKNAGLLETFREL
ncbi:universal stress protein [Fulvivirga sp. M361]|uniref:universal stress protein n=1 Tax=Fulvivirga sp. M361 TaxID=2594266 RepID=UPI00117AD794|nr:universal stress protein [Fulvivirga sp. M361]TRX60708.1 universal stress protein [Fulvivirga sp. M361]